MWEAVGQAISYGISSNASFGGNPMYSNLALIVVQFPFTWMIIRTVPKYRGDDLKRPSDHAADEENNRKIADQEPDADAVKATEAHEMGPTTVSTTTVR